MVEEFRRIGLPYCLKQLEDGSYVLLNRKYKPVGFNTEDHLDYEDYPIKHKIKITPKKAASLSWDKNPDTKTIFFYNDGCIPTSSPENMKKYLKILDTLSRCNISL